MKGVIYTDSKGIIHSKETIVIVCSCGPTKSKVKKLLDRAGVNIKLISTGLYPVVRRYAKQIGLTERVSSLKGSTHAVIYNPKTEQFIDLLRAPENEQTVEDIKVLVG